MGHHIIWIKVKGEKKHIMTPKLYLSYIMILREWQNVNVRLDQWMNIILHSILQK